MPSKWLDWTGGSEEITEKSSAPEPSKPSKPGFDGFDGNLTEPFPVTPGHEQNARPRANAKALDGCSGAKGPFGYSAMPKGIRLIRWEPKTAPVVIDVCSVVVDVSKFIAGELRALDSRLNNPATIHGGFSVPQMLDRLAQVGVTVELDHLRSGDR
jgi:hypothetical protein